MKISGNLAVVSGASSGIGRAAAVELARRGAKVVLLARGEETLEQTQVEVRKVNGRAWAYPVDLTRPEQVQAVGQIILEQHGTPQIVVHSAGAGQWKFLEESSAADLEAMMAAPYFAAAYLTRVLLPAMLEANEGLILSVLSPASKQAWRGATGYVAARWALAGFTEALRADLWDTRLKVCAFYPGKVDSEYFIRNRRSEGRIPTVGKIIPTLSPEQVARHLVRAIERESREVLIPWQLKAFDVCKKLLPGLMDYMAWSTGPKRER
jgi:short-subunit dehydrogenase